MVEDRPKRALSSMLAARRGSSCCDLGDVIPANRCSPALNTQNYGLSTKDLFGHQNRILNAAGKNKDSSCRDREVIDLTTIPSPNEWPKTEDMQAPCSSKKPKIFEDPDNTVSCQQLHNMELALSPSSSMSTTVIKCNEESIFVQCVAAAVGASEINRTQNGFLGSSRGTTEAKITKFESDEKTKASDFLIQVKEQLTISEYAEFVGFMKALKSKTMRIIPVLESIVRLFSGTDRFHLLRRFKDYVPVKYQPIYEQHIMALDAAFGIRGESDHST